MENEILSFDIAKINRGKEKICKCKYPHYEIDTVNRLVMCTDCGAVVEPFDALLSFVERIEEIEQLQKRMREKAIHYGEFADEEMHRMIKNRVFREMNEKYKRDMIPRCPKCGDFFEPTDLKEWKHK